jgi:hypothetical protein
MPESDWSKLDSHALLAQPIFNCVGPGWSQSDPASPAGRTERTQAHTHLSLAAPGPEPAPRVPPPRPVTEAELRGRLHATQQAVAEASIKVAEAEKRHAAALVLIKSYKYQLASFDDIEAAIEANTLAMIRGASDWVDQPIPEAVTRRIGERVQVRIALAAAERAAAVLDAELADAKASHDAAAKAHDTAIAAILGLAADDAAREFWSALRAAEEAFIRLCAYDRFASPRGWIARTVVNSALREQPPDFRRHVGSIVVDPAPWQRAYDALRSDPGAPPDVPLPAAPRRIIDNTVAPVSTSTMPELKRLQLVYAPGRNLPPSWSAAGSVSAFSRRCAPAPIAPAQPASSPDCVRSECRTRSARTQCRPEW